jgi:hypothetical protein
VRFAASIIELFDTHGDYNRCVAQKAAARNGIFSAGDRGTESEKRLEKIARNGQKRGLLVRWL